MSKEESGRMGYDGGEHGKTRRWKGGGTIGVIKKYSGFCSVGNSLIWWLLLPMQNLISYDWLWESDYALLKMQKIWLDSQLPLEKDTCIQ